MGPAPAATDDTSGPSVAVEVARLTGRIDQVIVDHERRLATLEARSTSGGARAAAIASPWIAAAAVVIVVLGKVQWV